LKSSDYGVIDCGRRFIILHLVLYHFFPRIPAIGVFDGSTAVGADSPTDDKVIGCDVDWYLKSSDYDVIDCGRRFIILYLVLYHFFPRIPVVSHNTLGWCSILVLIARRASLPQLV